MPVDQPEQPKPEAQGESGQAKEKRPPRAPRKQAQPAQTPETELAAKAESKPGQEMQTLAGTNEPEIIIDSTSQTIPDRMKLRAQEQGSGLVLDRRIRQADQAEHLGRSKAAILDAADKAPKRHPRKALILGPGPAHDIPLAALATTFDEITLVDIDGQRVKDAVDALPENVRGKFKIIVGDVTGGFFTDYPNAIQQAAKEATSFEDFIARATAITDGGLEPHAASFGKPESFAFVCSQLVMSQLPAYLSDYLTSFMTSDEFRTRFAGNIPDNFSFYFNDPRMRPFQDAFIRHLRPLLTQSHVQTALDAVPKRGIVYLADTTSMMETTRIGFQGPVVPTGRQAPMYNRYAAASPIQTNFDVVSYTERPWTYRSATPSLDGSVTGIDFSVSADVLRKN